MDTVCRFAIELSLKMRTIGSRIRLRDQKVLIDGDAEAAVASKLHQHAGVEH